MLLFFFQFLFGNNFFLSKSWKNSARDFHASPTLCFRLLEAVLGYINAVAQSVEKNADKLTAKFWRALLSKAYDVLDKVGLRFSPRAVLCCCFYVTVK